MHERLGDARTHDLTALVRESGLRKRSPMCVGLLAFFWRFAEKVRAPRTSNAVVARDSENDRDDDVVRNARELGTPVDRLEERVSLRRGQRDHHSAASQRTAVFERSHDRTVRIARNGDGTRFGLDERQNVRERSADGVAPSGRGGRSQLPSDHERAVVERDVTETPCHNASARTARFVNQLDYLPSADEFASDAEAREPRPNDHHFDFADRPLHRAEPSPRIAARKGRSHAPPRPRSTDLRTASTKAIVPRMTERRTFYPPIEPYRTGLLRVDTTHEVYFEESGNPNGKPVVFVHGGPGGGTEPKQRRFFDPSKYRIVLFDQRGCGKSTPYASLVDNTTWHLVGDMEKLREHLGIERWQVFGGSWGSTLGLAYAETHPSRVTELVLRGIFLLRKREIDWFYQEGASRVFPDVWESYVAAIPEAERGDFVSAYYKRLTSDDANVRLAAARAWSVWEGSTSTLLPDLDMVAKTGADTFAEAFARIECHYFIHKGFFESDAWLLENVGKIRHIPTVIVQGRYDVVCPMDSAWALHRAFPEADLRIVPDAGHAAAEAGTLHELVRATDRFAR